MIPNRYNVENIRKVLANPSMVIGEARRTGVAVNRTIYSSRRDERIDIFEEDWDNLLILDGCRYDCFAEQVTIDGNLEKRRSDTSHSTEFIAHNFQDQEHHDTVYITTNPYVRNIESDTFYAQVDLLDMWDDETQTVHPRDVAAATKERAELYDNKRLIVHFMQPHYPFIGRTGQEIDHRGFSGDSDEPTTPSIWRSAMYNMINISDEKLSIAYEENLEIVLTEVQDLLKHLSGKSVVTSDHGNMLGERLAPLYFKAYGHPQGVRCLGLNQLPWFVPNFDSRRKITADKPILSHLSDDDKINERLTALGYA